MLALWEFIVDCIHTPFGLFVQVLFLIVYYHHHPGNTGCITVRGLLFLRPVRGGGLLLVGGSGLLVSVCTEQTVSRQSIISAENSSITAQTSSSQIHFNSTSLNVLMIESFLNLKMLFQSQRLFTRIILKIIKIRIGNEATMAYLKAYPNIRLGRWRITRTIFYLG